MKKRTLAVLFLAMLSLAACQSGKEAKKEETHTQESSTSDSQASADGSTEQNSTGTPEEKDKASLEVGVREPYVEGGEKKKFEKRMDAEIGEEIEIRVHYKNLSGVNVENVFVKVDLPSDELEYVDQSARLIRADHQDGLQVESALFDKGINIGNYAPRGDGYIRFRCKVKSTGKEEYGGNLKISATSFDGKDLQSDWAGIQVKNAQKQSNSGQNTEESMATSQGENTSVGGENTYGWADNGGGRRTYTVAEINDGALGNQIVFNSIEDDDSTLTEEERAQGITTPLTDERRFIGIRDAATGNRGKENVWHIGRVEIEEGKTYIVRMYVHNNNPRGLEAVAKDVTAQFALLDMPNNEEKIVGYISSSNAVPSVVRHSILLKSVDGRPFTLKYVEGSALLENNVYKDGIKLSDELVGEGIKIGYETMDGNLPGCYQYSCCLTIKVEPVFQ